MCMLMLNGLSSDSTFHGYLACLICYLHVRDYLYIQGVPSCALDFSSLHQKFHVDPNTGGSD